jgi:hypothetical protein
MPSGNAYIYEEAVILPVCTAPGSTPYLHKVKKAASSVINSTEVFILFQTNGNQGG